MSVAPGWYKDPAEPTTQRYWDGEGWIGEPLPADATPPAGPPPEPASPAAPGGLSPVADQPAVTPPNGGAGGPQPWPPTAPFPPLPGAQPPTVGPPTLGPPTLGAPTLGPPPVGAPPPGAPPPPPGYPYPPHLYPARVPPRPHGLRLAPLGARLVARVIDIGAVLLLNAVVNGWFVWRYAHEVAPYVREVFRRSLAGNTSTDNLPAQGDQAGGLMIAILLIATALWFAYEVPATANTGQTLGKRVMRIKVVRMESPDRLGFGRSFRRWNTLGLPTLLWSCCVGFVLQFVDCVYLLFDRPLHQALHDKSAHTVVVEVPRSTDAEPAMPGGTP